MKKWAAVTLLAIAQFMMVLDSTVMNVSIATVVTDLHTDIAWMQMAISLYTLTMASFMLVGGKLGSIWGRKRALLVGGVIYAIGALVTGFSPNIVVLILGWSVTEGLGAALVIPAIAALIATNYHGGDRIVAYSIIGAASGIAAAAGPLIGGFVTTYLSWRYVFIGETGIMVLILLLNKLIHDIESESHAKIDILSVLLSVFGFTMLVYGMLQSKTWGWVIPIDSSIALFGISPVVYLIICGAVLLKFFYDRQRFLENAGRDPLLKVSMLSIKQLRAGLSSLMAQYVIIGSVFFIIPIYLQMTLGYDALKTGIEILPLSAALVVFSAAGARLSGRWSAKRIVRLGQILLIVGAVVLIMSISVTLRNAFFMAGMACLGAGLGILASQLGNINMSAVPEEDSAEVGGLQGVSQNLGSSLGTALVGSLLVVVLTTTFMSDVQASSLPQNIKDYVSDHSSSVSIVSVDEVSQYASSQGLSSDEVNAVVTDYTKSQVDAIKESLVAIVVIGVFSLFISRNIPHRIMEQENGGKRKKPRGQPTGPE